jgi:hypothetical protein
MLDEETFIINFNSQGSQVINNGNLNAVSYNCPFGALPRKYNKYRVRLNFRSNAYLPGALAPAGSVLTDVGMIGLNFAKSYVFDGASAMGNVAMIYPIVTNAAAALNSSYYVCTGNDNSDYIIDYPQSGAFTITLKTFAGVAMANMQHYNLQVLFTGLSGPNIGNSNLLAFNKPTTY